MNQVLIERFVKLIAQNTGLLIRLQDWNALTKKLLMRVNALKLSSLEEYYQLLEKENEPKRLDGFWARTDLNEYSRSPIILDTREWKQLLQLLTTGESYFFRDSGQFFLLRNIILPELIAYQRQVWERKCQEKPTLRIWSAGCSTGEEPYSLAILLTELIRDWQNWNLCILGTDINTDSIQKAQAGVYGTWSFRTVDEQKKTSYFHLEKYGWKIQESIRNLVRFESGNLVQDSFPDPGRNLFNMDLIVCRNVFVYFEAQAIAQVLQKFYQTLRPGGYLFTAHAELYGQDMGLFSPKVFPQSVIYQRPQQSTFETDNFSSTVDSRNRRSSNFSNLLFSSNLNLFDLEANHPSQMNNHLINPINPITTQSQSTESNHLGSFRNVPPSPDRLSIETDIDTDLLDLSIQSKIQELNELFENHKYPEVIQVAQQIITLQPNNSEVYYILARSFANLGNYSEAEKYCHQAIHFNYYWIEPYYLLAGIAEEKGDIDIAKTIFKKIIYLSPSSINAYLNIAELYEKEGNIIWAKKMRKNVIFILENMPKHTLLARDKETIKAGDLLNYIKKLLGD